MTQQEAKTLLKKHAGDTIESWGFIEKKVRRAEAIYIKSKDNGFEEFGVSTLNYMPMVQYRIGITKRLNQVEDILNEINTKYALNLNLDKTEFTIACRKNKLELDIALPTVEDEQGVVESCKILLDYIGNTALPMFNLFDDIHEIDKRVNGEGENWDEPKDFTLGHFAAERRFIIARLCKNDKAFQDFSNKRYAEIDQNLAKMDKPKFDRNDENHWVNQMIHYLNENVQSIN